MPLPPVLINAFLQVDLVDGYGFLDVRGALIRQFNDEFQTIAESIEPNIFPRLIFERPVDPEHPVTQLKVGVEMVWMHFQGGATPVAIRQEGSRIVEAACALMGATRFRRQGLRLQYLFGTDTMDAAVDALRRARLVADGPWSDLGTVGQTGANIEIDAGRMKVMIRIGPAQRRRAETGLDMEAETPDVAARAGILFDIDVFDSKQSDTRDPKPHLNRSLKYIEEQALPLASQLLAEGSHV